jgi:anti-anti-sigma regulatory factor
MFELKSADALHHSVRGAPSMSSAKDACALLDSTFADLGAANAAAQERATPEAPIPVPVVEMSLSGVTEGSSVLVSLLLVWMRRARAAGVDIVFVDIPPRVATLIEFTGLDEVLPMARP